MAITRLTDIITVFDSKWTYGDVKFGYDGEVNQDHDTQYPLMLVNPPESTIPVIYDGREEYSFEVNFYNLYSQAAKDVVTLQKRWDNLQDLSNEWLDMVLKNYQDVTVEAYLNDESIEIERVKDTNNDKLVQIKLTFTMSAFTKCFRPVSNYPTDFSDLKLWLRADSGVTFDIPTKKVSAWSDESSSSNNFSQSTKAKQPLRYGYGGENDKAYFDFNGTSNTIPSIGNSPIETNFTIFEVSKIDAVSDTMFGYSNSGKIISIGLNEDGHYTAIVNDGINQLRTGTSVYNTGSYHIGVVGKEGKTINVEYYDDSNSITNSYTNGSFDNSVPFNETILNVGSLDGTTELLDGSVQEVIVYNRKLSDAEVSKVVGYLNLKYKIY